MTSKSTTSRTSTTSTSRRRRIIASVSAVALCGTVGSLGTTAQAAVVTDSSALRNAVTVDGVMTHLHALQDIADANGGTRAAGTPGHAASVDYIEGKLRAAGYTTSRQPFTYERTEFGNTALQRLSPNPATYELGVDFYPADYTGEGDVTAPVRAVDVNLAGDRASTSGCDTDDFAGFPAGAIALIQRGSCNFSVKADNAKAAGASAAIIFNQGNVVPGDDRLGLFGATLDPPPRTIPVVTTSFALGEEWVGQASAGLILRLNVDVDVVEVQTENLLADSTGRADRTVVVGGHLDSVPEGPGINDNGSGTATILETALQMSRLGIKPENRVRFAFWSGEEDGLIGSSYYVSQLSARDIKNTMLNLNFDMVGSPNAVNFVYDGDGKQLGTAGPNGSALIESVFTDFFKAAGKSSEPSPFNGRSDYFAFINAGIPAGGLFTGAEGVKTPAQAATYGGTAGVAYDPCYHQACDTIDNLSLGTLDVMSDAVAHATLTFARTTSAVNGTGKGNGYGKIDWEYIGNDARR